MKFRLNFHEAFLCCLFLVLFVPSLSEARDRKEKNRPATFRYRGISGFPAYFSNLLLNKDIPTDPHYHYPRLTHNRDSLFCSHIAYSDTISCMQEAELTFTITRRGKIADLRVEGLQDETLKEEVKRVFLKQRTWHPARKDGKKVASTERMTISLPAKGKMVVLDEEPLHGYKYKSRLHKTPMNSYVNSIFWFFTSELTSLENMPSESQQLLARMKGCLEVSFIVHKDGTASHFEHKQDFDNVSFDTYKANHTFLHRGLFYNSWRPAILDGKPVSVLIKARADYDKRTYSWECYILNE